MSSNIGTWTWVRLYRHPLTLPDHSALTRKQSIRKLPPLTTSPTWIPPKPKASSFLFKLWSKLSWIVSHVKHSICREARQAYFILTVRLGLALGWKWESVGCQAVAENEAGDQSWKMTCRQSTSKQWGNSRKQAAGVQPAPSLLPAAWGRSGPLQWSLVNHWLIAHNQRADALLCICMRLCFLWPRFLPCP